MKVQTKGKTFSLKGLSDAEYDRAKRLAAKKSPLDQCPTCGGKTIEIPDSGGVREFRGNTYIDKSGKKVECDCRSQMAFRARYLLANIGDHYMRLDWDDFRPQKLKSTIDDYVENWEDFLHHGYGMEMGGSLGVGKTFAATYIGKEMIKRNQSVYFIEFLDLVSAFDSEDQKLEERLRDSTFLIIDEVRLGFTDRQASLFANRFEALIRHRSNYNLPTIITTNLSEEELTESYPRVYSLLSAKQIRIEFDGQDARPKKGSEIGGMIIHGQKHPIT